MLTAKQVQTDVYKMLCDSPLLAMISGTIYRAGYRPRDSKKEDIVIVFTTGLSEEIETGVVTINAYVPDIDPFENGVFVEDGQRTQEIEQALVKWVQSLTAQQSDYYFRLQKTIYTMPDEDIKQHFVVAIIEYKHY